MGCEIGPVQTHRICPFQFALIHQDGNGSGGGDRFGEGCQIVDGMQVGRFWGRRDGTVTPSLFQQHGTAALYPQHHSGRFSSGNGLHNQLVDCLRRRLGENDTTKGQHKEGKELNTHGGLQIRDNSDLATLARLCRPGKMIRKPTPDGYPAGRHSPLEKVTRCSDAYAQRSIHPAGDWRATKLRKKSYDCCKAINRVANDDS